MSPSDDKRADIIANFNLNSRYLEDFFEYRQFLL